MPATCRRSLSSHISKPGLERKARPSSSSCPSPGSATASIQEPLLRTSTSTSVPGATSGAADRRRARRPRPRLRRSAESVQRSVPSGSSASGKSRLARRSRDGGTPRAHEVREQPPRLVAARRVHGSTRRAPSSAAPAAGCSGRCRASARHTCRHTLHCDPRASRVQHPSEGRERERCAPGPPGALVVALVAVCARRRRPGGPFTAWSTAEKIDEIAGNSPELNTPSHGRLSDPVSGRAQPVHGLEPARRRGPARHLGRPPGEHGRSVGRAGEPRASRSTRPRTTSARRRFAEAACSS